MTLDFIKLSPTGNTTILVTTPVAKPLRAGVAQELMKSDSVAGEQVGFLEKGRGCDISLYMMGGEFCANATMAASAYLARLSGAEEAEYLIEVSGADSPLRVQVKKDAGGYISTVPLPLPATLSEITIRGGKAPLVRLPGISHAILPLSLAESFSKDDIRALSASQDSEAFGLLFYTDGEMRPYVYVKPTDSAVWESACGSGTAAVGVYSALALGLSEVSVSQPGGVIRANARAVSGAVTRLTITGKTRLAAEGRAYI